jgi:hypothetical protein
MIGEVVDARRREGCTVEDKYSYWTIEVLDRGRLSLLCALSLKAQASDVQRWQCLKDQKGCELV